MPRASALGAPLKGEPEWPVDGRRRRVFLLDASSRLETRLLRAWIERNRPEDLSPDDCDAIRIPPSRRRASGSLELLEASLASGTDCLLAPLRVAWLPKKRDGKRSVRLSDLATGDPRDPGPLRQWWVLRRERDRCRVVLGEPAPVSELRERWRRVAGSDLDQATSLAEFVARQATLALERAERGLRGARYKVPRLVREDILGRASFRGGLAKLSRELSRTEASIARDASRYLREIAATHSPFVIDIVAHLIRLLYTQGYEEALYYDGDELEKVEALAQRHPVVFLPSHKSNLDHLVLQYMLHENGHAPNHTAGGINMNFFPVGPLVRRSGVFFIRRTFRDNAVYKFVLRHYVDYLVEKRFSLEWYIEGGRSRSGKLLPPRFGMLAYVVDAYRRGKAEDVILLPVSIAYDQIQEAAVYAAEQSGAPKQPESFGWFVRFVRAMRRRYGRVHIRFGEPVSLAKAMGAPNPDAEPNPDEQNLQIQKLAFETAARINRVTPITPTALVTLALLDSNDRALTLGETETALENLLLFLRRRNLPTTGGFDLYDPEGIRQTIDALIENGVVSEFCEGSEPVYRISPEKQLAASYYRNNVIHFFVNSSIAELALLRAGEANAADPVAVFWSAAMQLRDLLKFEFFFAEKELFRSEMRRELATQDREWEQRLSGGTEEIRQLLLSFRPFSAHRALRPFLEAYRIVGDYLEGWPVEDPVDADRFVSACTGLGKQYHLQRQIRSAASVSQVLLRTALRLAENRGLLDPHEPDVARWRRAFAEEIRESIRRVDAIGALAESRRVGLID